MPLLGDVTAAYRPAGASMTPQPGDERRTAGVPGGSDNLNRGAGLLSAGGLRRNIYGVEGDPNALPFLDPQNSKIGTGGAYLNLLQRPSEGVSQIGRAHV